MMLLALWVGCASGPDALVAPAPSLPAPRLLRRISLDLRGVLPSPEELDAVEADPTLLDATVDAYLEDPLFEERLVDLLSERFLTRIGEFEIRWYDYALEAADEFPFERAVADEPLRLMARIAAEDRPWSEIVTTDTTMADALLGEIWPVDYPAGATGWQEVRYTDLRPAAGILATNGLWWRYLTTPSNMNRRRAAAIMHLLLCEDIQNRPVTFTGSASVSTSTEDAIANDPGCQACHVTVDPIAASFFGFYWLTQYNVQEMTTYHRERELLAEEIIGVPPSWFGTPHAGLADLGKHIAADPRFARCAAQTTAELLWRREVELSDFERIETLRQVYLDDPRLKPVIRAVVLGETYADPEPRMASPEQLADAVEALTGYRWQYGAYDQLANDEVGYRMLGGGVDGENVTRPQASPGLTWGLVVKRLAQAAAQHAELEGDPAELHWRLYGARPDDEWLAAIDALSVAAEAEADAEAARQTVLGAMLRDPLFVSY